MEKSGQIGGVIINRRDFIKLSAAALTMPLVGLPELAEVDPAQASYNLSDYYTALGITDPGLIFYEMGQGVAKGVVAGIDFGYPNQDNIFLSVLT